MADYIEYRLYNKSITVNTPYGGTLYQSLYIDVSAGYDADTIASEFTFTTDADWIDLTPNGNRPYFEIVKDTSGNDCPQVVCLWSVSTNNTGVERTGVINIAHPGGWTATYTITQIGGIISPDYIPSDAYKEIIPGTTPWVTTRNQENFPEYNWDRAEKVLYMTGDCLLKPSASLFVPSEWITEDTIVNYCIEADENSRNTISDWLYDFGKDNGWWTSTDYPSFKHWGFDVGSRYTFEMTTVTHRTVKLTFVLRNYNGETDNYFAVPFRIVQCKKGITKSEFDEIVEMYGPSNFDGTMNNLDRFGFEDNNDITDPSTPSDPTTPNTPSTPEPEFTGNLTFRESEMNVPASTYINVAILNAKGLKKTDLSKVSIVSSTNWISDIVKTYKTNINGDAYLWITFKTDENTGDARTGNIDVSINSKTATLKINQVAIEDTTTDTTNDLTTVPRFDGENNISVKSDAKTNTATLNVWEMTEQECTDKVTVRTNAAWIKNLNIKYVKKDK